MTRHTRLDKKLLNKIGDVRTGKADFRFKVMPILHTVGVDELEREMKTRWKMNMTESFLPGAEDPDRPDEQPGNEMAFLED